MVEKSKNIKREINNLYHRASKISHLIIQFLKWVENDYKLNYIFIMLTDSIIKTCAFAENLKTK